jgi:peptide/nickel transport system ATP-binding protein
MTAPLLLTENLTVTYGRRGRQVRAVRGVSLHVDRGETVAIVGESGSGKSSLVNALLGLTPSRTVEVTGRACIADTEVTGIDERALSRVRGKRVGYIPQDPAAGLNPARRVAAQLADAVTVHDRDQDRAALRVRIGEALAEVGLADVDRIARAYPHELSGGQRQRVLIAMALINSPELVVADEPTSALDVTTQKAILDRLAELRRDRHLGLLLVTHDLGVAHERADRIFVMREGLLVSHGTPDDITSSSEPYTRALVDSAPSITSPRLRPATAASPSGPSTSRKPLLVVRGLAKHYGRGSAAVAAVTGADLTIHAGRTHALVGESGAGKSTVARIIVGLVGASSGTASLDGEVLPVTARSRPRHLLRAISFVHQNPYLSLDPAMRVADVIAEPLVNHGVVRSSRERLDAVAPLLDQVGLSRELLSRHPTELSGGQRQRVAIARALALRPTLIVLDEAVSALDVIVQAKILQLLVDLQAEHQLSLLFITHDLGVVAQIADDVTVMRDGTVRESGPAWQVLRHPRDPYTKFLLNSVPSGPSAAPHPLAVGQ